ncbi:MAG TPA: potassium-transporting ATPase subunit KdpC [Meiothermus sp.]|nr:potassium-transporting ATPase subunit KdpC [Meiothermus sp.]
MDYELDSQGGSPGTWLRFTAVFLLLCGLLYPALTTWLARGLFPHQAEGSLIVKDGRLLGSELLGQPFSGARYFIGRPSAVGYDPRAAAGSNLAVSNPALRERVRRDAKAIAQREGVRPEQIPPDLLAASGSGLDPHISPEAARLQVARVAKARGFSPQSVQQMLDQYTERGLLGQPRINVLRLNLALDGVR